MQEIQSAETIKNLTAAFFERGFSFEYAYRKGGDSSCVYVYRFIKGKDFFEWRETSGAYESRLVVCVEGEFRFPDIEKAYAKQTRAFRLKHLFKKASVHERRVFFAGLLVQELQSGKGDFFGIAL